MIRKVTAQDAQRICEIYNYYVLHTAISFEIETVGETEMRNRIAAIITDGYPYYVYENEGQIVGYCYLNSWKSRCAYRTTTEISIYIDQAYQSKGIGSALMQHTLNNIGTHLHTIIAGIALPNHGSVALHEKFGFHQISHFREVGYKFDKWQDIGHWQLILKNKMRILILCTGNSCRSQMAHGFLQSFDKGLTVCSAGTEASGKLNQGAVKAMSEVGIDISFHTSDSVEKYLNEEWDYVITVCGGANESCPTFTGKVKHRLHFGFDDPSEAKGAPEFIENEFRRVRDAIRTKFYRFYVDELMEKPSCPCGANDYCKCE